MSTIEPPSQPRYTVELFLPNGIANRIEAIIRSPDGMQKLVHTERGSTIADLLRCAGNEIEERVMDKNRAALDFGPAPEPDPSEKILSDIGRRDAVRGFVG